MKNMGSPPGVGPTEQLDCTGAFARLDAPHLSNNTIQERIRNQLGSAPPERALQTEAATNHRRSSSRCRWLVVPMRQSNPGIGTYRHDTVWISKGFGVDAVVGRADSAGVNSRSSGQSLARALVVDCRVGCRVVGPKRDLYAPPK